MAMNEKIQTTLDNFNRRGFKASFFQDKDEALTYVLDEIGSDDVGISGSMTIEALGWYPLLCERGPVHWHWQTPEDPETRKRANEAPAYILSANALSQNGEIVNIDGTGNRVAAAAYGKKKAFFVCGENKIAEDMQAAILRAKNIAAPLNAKRLGSKTPCALKGDKCYRCNSPERICRVTTITTGVPLGMEVHLLILAGDWGY